MKVILLADVPGSGKRDDIVTVSDGYARNFLFPKKLAAEATPGAMKEIQRKRAAAEAREAERKAEAEAKAILLKGKTIELAVRCGEKGRLYGSITNVEIAEQLEKQHGIKADRRKIEIKEQIRSVGEYDCSVWLYTGVIAEMKVHVVPAAK